MKKKLVFFVFIFLVFPVFSFAEEISSFDVSIVLDAGANRADITETIIYDFGESERRGIIRHIPETFVPRFAKGHIHIEILSVKDEMGQEWQTRNESTDQQEIIRIGNPDIYLTGKQTYVIHYSVSNPIGFFEKNDEFYWNVTGNQWQVPIRSSSVRLAFTDADIFSQALSVFHYCGVESSTDPCTSQQNSELIDRNEQVIFLESQQSFAPGEGMTIDVEFAKGFAPDVSHMQKLMYYLRKYGLLLIAFLLVVFLNKEYIRRWYTYKKFKAHNPLVTQYDPGEFSVAEAGFLYNNGFSNTTLGAHIVDLAIKGALSISSQGEDDLVIVVHKDFQTSSPEEQQLLSALDNLVLTDGKMTYESSEASRFRNIQAHTRAFEKKVVSGLKDFVANKVLRNMSKKNTLFLTLALLPFLGFSLVFIFLSNFTIGLALSIVLGITLITRLVLPRLPKLSPEGYRAKRYVEGLYHYIDYAEDDRINTLNSQAKTPELYEKLLPFAMIFGLEKKWSQAFAHIELPEMSWYQGDQNSTFNSVAFGSQMSGLSSRLSDTMKRAHISSSSSSGGFSGGGGSSGSGGGGGGGSSW